MCDVLLVAVVVNVFVFVFFKAKGSGVQGYSATSIF